jgi:hypothetical protein
MTIDERFRHTGKDRDVWDLANTSKKMVAISTELPRDIMKLIQEYGEWMKLHGLVPSTSAYSITKYCLTMACITWVAESGNDYSRLLKYLKWDASKNPKAPTKDWSKYEGATAQVSTGVPTEIMKLMEYFGPGLVRSGAIETNTPYNVAKHAVAVVMKTVYKEATGKEYEG